MPAPLASDYALPAYAQLSPQDEISFAMPTLSASATWDFVAPGDYVFLVVSLLAVGTTDAVAGTRSFGLAHRDGNGTFLSNVPGAATIGPGSGFEVNASVQITSAFVVGTAQMVPLPAIPLAPGMSLRAVLSNADAGDTFAAPILTVLRYATAPELSAVPPAATPTPLIA